MAALMATLMATLVAALMAAMMAAMMAARVPHCRVICRFRWFNAVFGVASLIARNCRMEDIIVSSNAYQILITFPASFSLKMAHTVFVFLL